MKVKLLSWNIWIDGNFEEIKKFLKDFDADIVGLQEVLPEEPHKDIISFMKSLGYVRAISKDRPFLKDKETMIISNAIFSKYEILRTENYTLSEVEKRRAVRADIKVGWTILHAFSTHLKHTHQEPSELQTQQAEHLISVLPKDPTIVMGDFNALPGSETIKKMTDVVINTDPSLKPTWSQYVEGCTDCKPQGLTMRLDYIFASKDIKFESPTVEYSKGSDHLPISVVIEV